MDKASLLDAIAKRLRGDLRLTNVGGELWEDGWVGTNAEFQFLTQVDRQVLHVTLYLTANQKARKVKIRILGSHLDKRQVIDVLPNQSTRAKISDIANAGIFLLQIAVDGAEQRPGDARKLGAVIVNISLSKEEGQPLSADFYGAGAAP